MKKSRLVSGFATAIALATICALTGCAPAVHPHPKAGHSHPSTHTASAPTATPISTPTAAALGPLPANALFRITATVTEPTGASADLVQTVFAPSAATPSDTALLDAQCNLAGQPTWESAFSSPLFLTTTITATHRAGTPAWPASDEVAAYFMGSTSAYSGGYTVAQADCAPGYIVIPGTMHGVAPVDAANPASGQNGWAAEFGEYGFDGSGNDPGAEDQSGTGVVKDCVIVESAAAQAASSVAAGWLTQPFQLQYGCNFQGAGPA
jgi:hypothetical protein